MGHNISRSQAFNTKYDVPQTRQNAGAQRAWRKSLALARQMAMPYEEGRAQYEIGRHAQGEERRLSLTRAAEIFKPLGAAYDLERARPEEQAGSEEAS